MITTLVKLVAMVAVSVADDDVKEQAIKQETENLQGKWRLVRVECKDRLCPPKLKQIMLIKGNRLLWLDSEGKVRAETAFRLDPNQTPKTFDESTAADTKEERFDFKGIYKLEGDTLTIHYRRRRCCFNEVLRRPKEFQIGDVGIILIYQRIDRSGEDEP